MTIEYLQEINIINNITVKLLKLLNERITELKEGKNAKTKK